MTNQTEMRFSFRRVDPAITVRSTTIYVHLESLELMAAVLLSDSRGDW